MAEKLGALKQKIGMHDKQILAIFEAIRQLMAPPDPRKTKPIGFVVEEKMARYGSA